MLFVHGIGEQQHGDTITEMGELLSEWLRRWIRRPGAPSDAYRVVGADADSSGERLGGRGNLRLVFRPGGVGEPRSWLAAESTWADVVRAPSFPELAAWGATVGPWVAASQLHGLDERMEVNPAYPQPWRLMLTVLAWLTGAVVALAAALVATLAMVVALGLIVLRFVPIPLLRDAVIGLQRTLAGGFGDAFILVRSTVRFQWMAERVRSDVNEMARWCDRIAVVAHSQGSAVAWEALRVSPDGAVGVPASVPLYISFGQAVRKLKGLYLQRRMRFDLEVLRFWALVAASTVSLGLVAYFGLGVVRDAIDWIGPGRGFRADLLGAPHWRLFFAFLGAVFIAQFILLRVARARDEAADADLREDIVEATHGRAFCWLDLWGSADPVPNGPLLGEVPPGVQTYRVRNMSSPLLDHTTYRRNVTEFASALAFRVGRLVQPTPFDAPADIPAQLILAARTRETRVHLLSAARVALILGVSSFLVSLREDLPDVGRAALELPFVPALLRDVLSPFAGWVAAALVIGAAALLWWIVSFLWRLLIRADERSFFEGQLPNLRSRWAVLTVLAALVIPALTVILVGVWQQDWINALVYVALVLLAVPAAVIILAGGGRALGEPEQIREPGKSYVDIGLLIAIALALTAAFFLPILVTPLVLLPFLAVALISLAGVFGAVIHATSRFAGEWRGAREAAQEEIAVGRLPGPHRNGEQ